MAEKTWYLIMVQRAGTEALVWGFTTQAADLAEALSLHERTVRQLLHKRQYLPNQPALSVGLFNVLEARQIRSQMEMTEEPVVVAQVDASWREPCPTCGTEAVREVHAPVIRNWKAEGGTEVLCQCNQSGCYTIWPSAVKSY